MPTSVGCRHPTPSVAGATASPRLLRLPPGDWYYARVASLSQARSRSATPGAQASASTLSGVEIAVVTIVALVGLALRAYGHMQLPRLTDETLEVRLGWQIAHGDRLPLVGAQSYIGALYSYLVALVFLVWPLIDAGRLIAVLTGSLTLVATYLLGRELGTSDDSPRRGHLVGLLGMLFLTLSGPHIMVSSRIAYSNSLTPLFATAGLWLLARALRRREEWSLVGSAFSLSLAVQTHLTALPVVLGALLATLLSVASSWRASGPRSAWPSRRLMGAAVGVAFLGIANLVVYNATTGLKSLGMASYRAGRYTQATGQAPALTAWAERLGALVKALALAISHQVSEYVWPIEQLLAPQVVTVVALACIGLWSCARRRHLLPLLVTLAVILTIPIVTDRVEPVVPRVRHYASLLPLGALMVAEGLVSLRGMLADRLRWRWVAYLLLAGATVTIGTEAVRSLNAYTAERLSRADKNNLAYLATLRAVAEERTLGEKVYLDDRLADVLTMSGGRMLTHLRFAFELSGQDFGTIDVEVDRLPVGRGRIVSRRLILNAESVPLVEQRYRLEPLEGGPPEGTLFRVYRAYAQR